MEENNVRIAIQSLQIRETGKEAVKQHAEGRLRRAGEGWLLTYREGDSSGLGDTRTALRIEPDRAVLTRTGELSSQMIFQPGHTHRSLYRTLYGDIPMTVRTLSLKSDLTETGGHVSIHYQIQFSGGDAGETRLRLSVQTKENNRYDP